MRSWSHTPWLDDPSQSTVETIVIGGGWRDGWDGFRLVTAELGTVASPVESLVPVVQLAEPPPDLHQMARDRRE